MATPEGKQKQFDAMYDWCGVEIFYMVRKKFDPHKHSILDVGAGWGKYRNLFPDFDKMEAVEIWQPYIDEGMLEDYTKVHNADICSFEFDHYDIIIMGDVLEHISRPKAKQLIQRLAPKCQEMYIAVPYQYPQGPVHGNPYEEHQQPDLTEQIMEVEFPELRLEAWSKVKGIYVKK